MRKKVMSRFAWRTTTATALVMILVLQPPLVVAQSGPNSPAEADILDRQIKTAFAKKDYQHLVDLIKQRHNLGGHFPPPLSYIEAVAYFQLGQKSAALQALNNYFPRANHDEYPYNEAVELAARIRDEVDATNRGETTITWEMNAQSSGQALRHGHIAIHGRTASLIGITLECTYAGVSNTPGAIPGMPPGWHYYVRTYENGRNALPDPGHLLVSSFPNDVPVADVIGKHSIRLTMHLLTGDSAKHFPDNLRPPWDGWFDWSEKRWHAFMDRGPNGVVLWDRKRGTGPFGSASLFNDILSATYWQERQGNRDYNLTYLDSYGISFPSMETTQTVTLAEEQQQLPNDPNFCQVMGGGCQTLRTNVLSRFAQLQPTECSPRDYLEPTGFAGAVAAATSR